MSLLLARVLGVALLVTCSQGLDVLTGTTGTTQHKHKHKHHKHHKQHKALAQVNSTVTETPAALQVPQAQSQVQPQALVSAANTANPVPQQQLQHLTGASQSLAIFDSEAQQALPAIVDDVRKAAAHKAPLDELKKTHASEVKLLEEQEAMLKSDQTGLDKSALQQQVDSTKAMLQNLEGQIATKRQDAVDILGKALSDARTALVQASTEEASQEAAAREAEKQIKAAQQQKLNARKVIEQAEKVMDVFGGNSSAAAPQVPALAPTKIAQVASEPQELS
ncbi:unnamed protein product [Symbiodinium natans]|uniref:Uncharacterized protein n=1 Tax=Symbiodinium natans TaxID=878477 RepID=A0A812RSS6_9DINO|nr:unnamed protein product [Symbiodinium natans]